MSEFLKTTIINLNDYACPKVQFLIFKDNWNDWKLANTHFDMQKIFTVQKEKVWVQDSEFFEDIVPPMSENKNWQNWQTEEWVVKKDGDAEFETRSVDDRDADDHRPRTGSGGFADAGYDDKDRHVG